jgi:RHS repeat-associated protein
VWGEPVPASFARGTALGFTGHESDDDLGLVNMKGRVFDPRLGRFSTPDPVVAQPTFGQSWNPYSYVLNSPLAYVDPSGFDPDALDGSTLTDLPGGWGLHITGPTPAGPPPPPLPGASPPKGPTSPPAQEGPREAAEVGAATSPVDVSTTGTASGYVPQPVTTSPTDGSQSRLVLLEGGSLDPAWAGDKLNPVTAEGRLARALLGNDKPVEPWTPPAAVALTRAGMHMIPGLNSVLVLGDPNASPLHKVLAVSTDVLSVVGVGVVLKAGRAGIAAAARGPAATRQLAQQIANVERIPMRFNRTVTVLETAEGPTLVAGGASDLSAAQIAAARRLGLTPTSPLRGLHAEKTAIAGAGELGLTPTKGATSTIICSGPGGCAGFLEGLGAKVGKYTYEF